VDHARDVFLRYARDQAFSQRGDRRQTQRLSGLDTLFDLASKAAPHELPQSNRLVVRRFDLMWPNLTISKIQSHSLESGQFCSDPE
jgi:hypothetical protein